MMLDFQVDPRSLDTMSLAEIGSMMSALKKRREKDENQNRKTGRQVSDEEWAEAQEMLASVTVNDPSVRIH